MKVPLGNYEAQAPDGLNRPIVHNPAVSKVSARERVLCHLWRGTNAYGFAVLSFGAA
jgi:hypothetical protein